MHFQETQKLVKEIKEKAAKLKEKFNRPVKIMEVCGSHTEAIAKYGIKSLLPENIKLVSGPGCPVCVTPKDDIDAVIALSDNGIPIATYGDMLKVPGTRESLEDAKRRNNNIHTIYSTEELVKLPKNTVFFGIGFETTTPMTAFALKEGICVYCSHKTMPQVMQILIEDPELSIDGFLDPGHVSSIIGLDAYKNVNACQVIAGFLPRDVLEGISMICDQLLEEKREVRNQYTRLVTNEGNTQAQGIIKEYFKVADVNWRGIGVLPDTGLEIADSYKDLNAKIKYKEIIDQNKPDPTALARDKACLCGNIIKGIAQPEDCPLFKSVCSPEAPIGPCMVGREGSCNVAYRYKSA